MVFEGVQRLCPSCHCQCNKHITRVSNSKTSARIKSDVEKSTAAYIHAEENINRHDSVVGMTKNQDHSISLCLHCKMILKQVNSLLKNVEDLDNNEWRNICEHCKKIRSTNQCKRDSYLFSQIKKGKEKCQNTEKWKDMLDKLKLFLETLTINKRCIDSCEVAPNSENLAKIFEPMQMPSTNRVVIKESSDLDVLKCKNTWKYLDNLKIENPRTSEIFLARKAFDLLPVRSKEKEVCICQKLSKINENLSFDTITEEKPLTININSQENIMNRKKIDDVNVTYKPPLKGLKTIKKSIKVPSDVKKIGKKSVKVKAEANSDLFTKMILKERKNRDHSKVEDRRVLEDLNKFEIFLKRDIVELPPLPVKVIEEKTDDESGNVVKCKQFKSFEPTEVIHDNEIVTQERKNKQLKRQQRQYCEPLLFEVQHDFSDTTLKNSDDIVQEKEEHRRISVSSSSNRGRIKYQLSNRRYIEEGITVLPKFKIMRRMKLYKMIPSLTKFDWLGKYKDQKYMFYCSGEKLSEMNDDGQFRWYYKDGCIALDFCNTIENIPTEDILIYDSIALRKKSGQPENNLILARFDKMGHGIVYDRQGRVRLKYNQCEGIILDKGVGSKARWKWNNLNDPPELQESFEECYDDVGNCLKNQNRKAKEELENEISSYTFDEEMYTIEIDRYAKENLIMMQKQYEQYQIKFKVFKINEHLTLKILEQSKIFLLFRDSEITFKLNLGLRLLSNVVIDEKSVELCDVVTPYDSKV